MVSVVYNKEKIVGYMDLSIIMRCHGTNVGHTHNQCLKYYMHMHDQHMHGQFLHMRYQHIAHMASVCIASSHLRSLITWKKNEKYILREICCIIGYTKHLS